MAKAEKVSPIDTDKEISVHLAIVTDGELKGILQVGNQLTSDILQIHDKLETFPLIRVDYTFLPGLQPVYRIENSDYFKTLLGSFVCLSHSLQRDIFDLSNKPNTVFYLTVNY